MAQSCATRHAVSCATTASSAHAGMKPADSPANLSHDDFAPVAADSVRRGVTRPNRIAAEGGSSGGLLIANMLTRYPERFGALFCTILTCAVTAACWAARVGPPNMASLTSLMIGRFWEPLSAYLA